MKKVIFKLKKDFNINKLKIKIDNLEYYEALDILVSSGVDKEYAAGILFNDYNILESFPDIIIEENPGHCFGEPFDLFGPIKQLNQLYYEKYRELLENVYRYLSCTHIFIDILNTPDYNIQTVSKYFPFSMNLIFDENCKGGIYFSGFEFYSRLNQAYDNGDFANLIYALRKNGDEIKLLENSFYTYLDAKQFVNDFENMEDCLNFLIRYCPYQINVGFLLDDIVKFRRDMSSIYSRSLLFRESDIVF